MNRVRVMWFGITAFCLAFLCAFVFTGRVEASPAAPVDITLTQPDGTTTFLARQWGDEWNHGYETIEGFTILPAADGWWVYAEPQADGLLAPALVDGAARKVGIDSPDGLALHLRPAAPAVNPNAASLLSDDGITAPEYQNIGTQSVLVLLVQYTGFCTNKDHYRCGG